jgi:tetratricopeptide (TPR) repeat protein
VPVEIEDAPGSPPEVPVDAARKLLVADAASLKTGPALNMAAAHTPEDKLQQAILRARSGELEAARSDLRQLADGPATPRPVRAAADNNLGNIDTLLKRFDDATQSYERALAGGADARQVEHNLGVVHYLAGRGGEAKKHLQKSGTPEAKKLMSKLGLSSAEPKKPKKPAAGPAAPAPTEETDAREGLRGAPGESRLDPADHLIWMK